MKNFKKLISAVTAFAMTATMFAGLGISANAAVAVYVDENFDSYENQTIQAALEGNTPPEAVTLGSLIYTAGTRTDGLTNTASIADDTEGKQLDISADRFSNANRGIGIQFAEEAGIPAYSEI